MVSQNGQKKQAQPCATQLTNNRYVTQGGHGRTSRRRKTIPTRKSACFRSFWCRSNNQIVAQRRLHWNTIYKDATEIVKKWPECQKYNIVKQGFHPLRTIHAFLPCDHWAIDLAGPFRTTFLGNNYLLVMVDICTRFCTLRPIHNKQSDTIVRSLIQVFCDFGLPRYLQSDNGTEFVHSLLKQLAEATCFDHRFVIPYHLSYSTTENQ